MECTCDGKWSLRCWPGPDPTLQNSLLFPTDSTQRSERQHATATSSADPRPLRAAGKPAPQVWVLRHLQEHGMSCTAPSTAAPGRWEGSGTSLSTRAILVVTRPPRSSSCGCREHGTQRDRCCLQRKRFSPQPSATTEAKKEGGNIPC